MPPKKAMRGRKKEEKSVVTTGEEQMNGSENQQVPVVKRGRPKQAEQNHLANGDAPSELPNSIEDVPPTKKRGRQRNVVESTAENGHHDADETEESNKLDQENGKAGQEMVVAQEQETKETTLKKAKGRTRKQDQKSIEVPESIEQEPTAQALSLASEDQSEQRIETGENSNVSDTKEIRKAKGRTRRQDPKSIEAAESTVEEASSRPLSPTPEDKSEQRLETGENSHISDTKETTSKKAKGRPRKQETETPEDITSEDKSEQSLETGENSNISDTKETASKKAKGRPRRQDPKSDDQPRTTVQSSLNAVGTEETTSKTFKGDDGETEKNGSQNSDADAKESTSKGGRGRPRRQDAKSSEVPEVEPARSDLPSDEQGLKSEKAVSKNPVTSSKGAKGRPQRNAAKSSEEPEAVQPSLVVQEPSEQTVETKEPSSKNPVTSSKGRPQRNAAKSSEEPEAAQSSQELSEQTVETKEPSSKNPVTTLKGRPQRNAAKSLEEPEAAQSSQEPSDQTHETKEPSSKKSGRGRPRKQEAVVTGLKRKAEEPSTDVPTKVLTVSLLRQKSVDAMAIAEMQREEGKVKGAVGPSKSGRKRGRGEDAPPSKQASKAPSKASSPKRGKIPDVSNLDFGNASVTGNGEAWNLKIASWNINGIRAWLEKDGVSYLQKECPDVLCVQETKCSEEKLPKEANVEGYHCYWLAGDKDGYSGVGMLAKKKPIAVEYGIGMEEHDAEGRVITADFDKFYLVAAYVPNAGRGLVRLEYRKQWDEDFRAYIKKLDATKPVILCGDLNVAHKEIDLANPKTNKKNAGFTQEERDGFSTLLDQGFVDAYRRLYPDKTGAYTFWTYMMNARAKNVGWRLDYFLMSERFADRLCDCCIRSEVMGSDHCPLVLFLSV